MSYPPIIVLAAIMCSTAVVITTLVLISRHVTLRRATDAELTTEEIVHRLERIEQAVDAAAVSVDRLAESSRFVAKLLAGRAGELGP